MSEDQEVTLGSSGPARPRGVGDSQPSPQAPGAPGPAILQSLPTQKPRPCQPFGGLILEFHLPVSAKINPDLGLSKAAENPNAH